MVRQAAIPWHAPNQVKEIRTRHSITNTPTHLQVSSDTTSFHDIPVVCNDHTRPSFFDNGIGLNYFVAYSSVGKTSSYCLPSTISGYCLPSTIAPAEVAHTA